MVVQVHAVGPTSARVMIVGEAPGEQEVAKGEPFVGASGMELSRMLHEAGILRSACFITNVCRERPAGNDVGAFIPSRKKDITADHVQVRDRMCLPVVREGLDLLKREIELVRPNVIIALGNVSLWALTGKWGITDWRGSLLLTEDLWDSTGKPLRVKVIPTYHPAAILRQWSWRATAVGDLKRVRRESESPEFRAPQYRFTVRPTFQEAVERLADLRRRADGGSLKLSVDLETRAGHIACIGLAWSKSDALCIPLMKVSGGGDSSYWDLEDETALVYNIYRLLTHPNVLTIGQNFLYDAQYIHRHWHFLPRAVRDTMIAHHSCFSNLPKGLDFLSSMYCEHHVYWKGESKDWDPKVGEEQLWTYNCKDAVITYEADEVIQASVDKLGLREVHDFQQSMFWPVLHTMLKGCRIDLTNREQFSKELEAAARERSDWFRYVLGHDLNPRSSPQMKNLFYEDFRQPVIRDRKSGQPTLKDEALTILSNREPLLRPLIKKISEFRSIGVFKSTFVDADLDIDQRMRCSYNICGTDTYRFSSSENAFGSGTNLQNIPKTGDEAYDVQLPNVRKLFVPDEGYTFFDSDFSKADLRIVTWESGEEAMKAMLREGRDPYVETAREYYRDPSIQKYNPDGTESQKYDTFKKFSHGTHYLGTAKGLSHKLGLTVHECDRAQKWYFGKYPRIKAWQEDMKKQLTSRRFIENAFGYRFYAFERLDDELFRAAIAWKPQSTIGILINKAYRNIHHNLPSTEVLLQVHDSLAGQFPTAQKDLIIPQILAQFQITIPYDDPLIIPVGIKTSEKSWGDCA